MACSAALTENGENGICSPARAGTNPRSHCIDRGAFACGTTGVCDGQGACAVHPNGTTCDEGMSCQAGECVGEPSEPDEPTDCAGKSDGTVCSEGDGCTLGLCRGGACVETHKLDGTRCEARRLHRGPMQARSRGHPSVECG